MHMYTVLFLCYPLYIMIGKLEIVYTNMQRHNFIIMKHISELLLYTHNCVMDFSKLSFLLKSPQLA